jgi:hypothetical protein
VTAIRSVRAAEGKFVQISNAALQDERLSWRARGVLAFVLSLPPDHVLTAKWLESQAPDGREAVRGALRELGQCGYYRRDRRKGPRGIWVWDQVLSDEAIVTSGEDGASPLVTTTYGFPSVGKPSDGNPSDKELKTEDPKTKDRSARAREADPPVDNSGSMTDMIISEIEERTQVRVSRDHAAQVARQILGRASSPPRKPLVFVRTAIRREEDPQNFVPTNTPPPYRAAPAPAKPPADADPWATPPPARSDDPPPLGVLLSAITRERMTGNCAPTAI